MTNPTHVSGTIKPPDCSGSIRASGCNPRHARGMSVPAFFLITKSEFLRMKAIEQRAICRYAERSGYAPNPPWPAQNAPDRWEFFDQAKTSFWESRYWENCRQEMLRANHGDDHQRRKSPAASAGRITAAECNAFLRSLPRHLPEAPK